MAPGPGNLSSRLVRTLVFPIWARREHPHYFPYLTEFRRTQFSRLREIKAIQLERLNTLLLHAFQQCPFYRERLERAGLRGGRIHGLSEFTGVPLLTKRDIQDYGAKMQARGFPTEARIRNQTGGSTGSPLQFYVDRKRLDSRMASTARHDEWVGMRPGDWRAVLWGARLDQVVKPGWWGQVRNNLLYRVVELNTSRIFPKDFAAFVRHLRIKRPRFLVAYAQSAVLFAKYVREEKIQDVRFDSIITTAEVLMPGQREFIEERIGGRVYNRYGCREVSVIASECECHTGMHVNAEALLVEIVPTAGLAAPAGKIVITDLLNFSMPLIRYEIGDVGTWTTDQGCPCGRGLPRLADVQGRTTDFLILPDGRRISGPALTLVVADMADVRQVQFVQKGPRQVTLRVVPGREYGPNTEQELRRRLGLYLEGAAELAVETVETIASEASGKYQFVVNETTEAPSVVRGEEGLT